ncbi:MAG: ABC transporter ATP-binding protein [Clostridia bacterium]|nr:ABC transporter ATP-binding protein [Clostridia bacterium]
MNTDNEKKLRSYISFENVRKTYKSGDVETDALKDVSFIAEKGEFCVLLGSSGAGKTTLLNMLGGMDTVTEGKIFLGDREVTALSPKELVEYRRFDVGFVFQFYNLIPNLTAKENVELAAMLCPDHLPAETALKLVGLGDRMDHFPSQLSGGEQQRVSIARALAKSPRLLLCDEPTGALDYQTGKNVLSLLYRLSKENGTTVVVITHNQAIAPMADRIIKIKNGSIESNTVNENVLPIEEIEW